MTISDSHTGKLILYFDQDLWYTIVFQPNKKHKCQDNVLSRSHTGSQCNAGSSFPLRPLLSDYYRVTINGLKLWGGIYFCEKGNMANWIYMILL